MRRGLLWFDDRADAPLAAKVERAAAHYADKYGQRPTVCYIHPSMAVAAGLPRETGHDPVRSVPCVAGLHGPAVIAGVQIRVNNIVLPNHFWLGDPQPEPQETA